MLGNGQLLRLVPLGTRLPRCAARFAADPRPTCLVPELHAPTSCSAIARGGGGQLGPEYLLTFWREAVAVPPRHRLRREQEALGRLQRRAFVPPAAGQDFPRSHSVEPPKT